MILGETAVEGAYVVSLEPRRDERGFFARAFDTAVLEEHGLDSRVAQGNFSHSDKRGTMRGIHWQAPPHAEAKVVRCVRGSIFDVVIDTRPDSATHGRWVGTELSAANRLGMYVPNGCGHGFLTLEDDVDVLYQVSVAYEPNAERGVRWNDPFFLINWPFEPIVITEKDATWRDYSDERIERSAKEADRETLRQTTKGSSDDELEH